MKKPIIMEKVKGALMKKMVSIMLILLLLFPVTVLAAGYDSLVATIDRYSRQVQRPAVRKIRKYLRSHAVQGIHRLE